MFAVLYAKDSEAKGQLPDDFIVERRHINKPSESPAGWVVIKNKDIDDMVKASDKLCAAWQKKMASTPRVEVDEVMKEYIQPKQKPQAESWTTRIKKAYLA